MNSNKNKKFRYFKDPSFDKQKFNSQHNDNKQQTKRSVQKSKRTKTRTKSLKKQIHDTQRLLFKNILCEEGSRAQQFKLEQLKKSYSEEKRTKNNNNKRVKRYKGIKFFDSRKVLKKLGSLENTNSDKAENSDGLEELALYKRYLNYITYYPADKKYISLFPNSERLDPNAQEQLDVLLREANSMVEQGLYADAWTAYVANTPTDTVHSSAEVSEINAAPAERTADLTALPMFIPIDTSGSQSPRKGDNSSKKRISKKSSFPRAVDTSQQELPTRVESTHDNSISEMECGEDLKCDSFFFFDTTGSEIDARLFKNRPQKRNFQDTRNQKSNTRSPKHNSRNYKQKGKDRGQS